MYYLFITFFCIFLNAVSPNCNSNFNQSSFKDLESSTNEFIELSEESKNKLQVLVKAELVKNRQIPETASIYLKSIFLDKKHQNVFAKQKYIVKILASWTSFFPHKGKAGLYILKMNKHNDYFVSCFSNDSLKQAQVNLPT